jgi:hypothetical protein
MMTKDALATMLRAIAARNNVVGIYTNETPPSSVHEIQDPLGAKPIPQDDWLVDEASSQLQTKGRYTFSSNGRMGMIYGYYIAAGDKLVQVTPLAAPVPFMTNEDKLHVHPRIRAREWA